MDPRKRKYEETSQPGRLSSAEFPVKGPCYLKVLLPEKVAGIVIGKGGLAITELENRTGASIKLAPSGVYYPGSNERSVSIGGDMQAIEDVVYSLTRAIREHSGMPSPFMMKMVAPSSSISGIIGRGGEVVRQICVQTNSSIKIQDRSESGPERIIDIRGGERDIFDACMALTSKIQDDPNLYEYASVLYPNNTKQAQPPRMPSPPPHQPPHQHHQPYNMPQPIAPVPMPPMDLFTYRCAIEFLVPTPAVPPVEVLADILQQTGSRVTVADCPGSDVDKTLTVSGPLSGVQAAHILLIRRVTDFLIQQDSGYAR